MCTPKNKNGRRIQRDRERIKLNQEIIKFKEDRILDFFFFFPFKFQSEAHMVNISHLFGPSLFLC